MKPGKKTLQRRPSDSGKERKAKRQQSSDKSNAMKKAKIEEKLLSTEQIDTATLLIEKADDTDHARCDDEDMSAARHSIDQMPDAQNAVSFREAIQLLLHAALTLLSVIAFMSAPGQRLRDGIP